MKLLFLVIVLLFAGGYLGTYLVSRNRKYPFLSAHARNRIRSFGITCFFLAVALCVLILYIRIRR
ncbi:hypothetical protein [Parapedobacter defluvii]|uniref:hypothetical protein n=1 Tax=Parapedobacter defluvii TaxID=2045106 RepID=UPI000FAEAAB9|nr:hypothetical protein [Parapedobacter defluvii]RQP14311.1 MAG: hypothetical protein EAS52_17695 [Parapedobacter sp.]